MFPITSPENAAAIAALEAHLRQLPMGAISDYRTLKSVASVDVEKSSRHVLARAIEAVERDMGCLFATVRGVGVKRLASSEMPEHGLATLARVRRAANRGRKRIERINVNSLSPDDQRRVIGYSAMLGAVSLIADGRRALAVAAVADPAKPIPPKNILDMFR